MQITLSIVKKRSLFRYWIVPLLVTILFLLCTVTVYGYLTGFNIFNVGASSYSYFSVGESGILYFVGGYSTNEASNTLAQTVLPILAVVAIICYGIRNYLLECGLSGFLWSMLIFVVGAILLGMIVSILATLT